MGSERSAGTISSLASLFFQPRGLVSVRPHLISFFKPVADEPSPVPPRARALAEVAWKLARRKLRYTR